MISRFRNHLKVFVLAVFFVKACQYAINDENVSFGLQLVNIKVAQFVI
jgi:hypothetical protein